MHVTSVTPVTATAAEVPEVTHVTLVTDPKGSQDTDAIAIVDATAARNGWAESERAAWLADARENPAGVIEALTNR